MDVDEYSLASMCMSVGIIWERKEIMADLYSANQLIRGLLGHYVSELQRQQLMNTSWFHPSLGKDSLYIA